MKLTLFHYTVWIFPNFIHADREEKKHIEIIYYNFWAIGSLLWNENATFSNKLPEPEW